MKHILLSFKNTTNTQMQASWYNVTKLLLFPCGGALCCTSQAEKTLYLPDPLPQTRMTAFVEGICAFNNPTAQLQKQGSLDSASAHTSARTNLTARCKSISLASCHSADRQQTIMLWQSRKPQKLRAPVLSYCLIFTLEEIITCINHKSTAVIQ